MGDGHLVHKSIINYVITIVNIRESGGRGGRHEGRENCRAKTPSLKGNVQCASGTEGGRCGSSMQREGQRRALNSGWVDRQEPEQTGLFPSSLPHYSRNDFQWLHF